MTSIPPEAWRNRTNSVVPNCPSCLAHKESLDLMKQSFVVPLLQGSALLDRLRETIRAAAEAVIEEQGRAIQDVRPFVSKQPMDTTPDAVSLDGDIIEHVEPSPHGIFGYCFDFPRNSDD